MTASERVLTRKTIATYAIGSLGTGGFGTLPGLVLVFYLTDTLGIAALAASSQSAFSGPYEPSEIVSTLGSSRRPTASASVSPTLLGSAYTEIDEMNT